MSASPLRAPDQIQKEPHLLLCGVVALQVFHSHFTLRDMHFPVFTLLQVERWWLLAVCGGLH